MNATQALAQARKRFKGAMVEDCKVVTSPETRKRGTEDVKALKARIDTDYKAMTVEARRQINKELSEARAASYRYRYQVGEFENMCGLGMFVVRGQGDTWAEAFAEADKRAKQSA